MGEFEDFIQNRITGGFDIKAVVVGRDSRTGLGKTTFALDLAEYLDSQFDAEKQCVFTVDDYIEAFRNLPPQRAIVWEEAQVHGDNRRSFSNSNVFASQLWSIMRFREMYSILTLPTRSMLDKRLIELSDLILIVVNRGRVHPYEVKVGDVDGNVTMRRLKDALGNKLYLTFPKHEDKNFQIMKQDKDKFVDEWVEKKLEEMRSD